MGTNDKKNLELDLKEALILFEASFVKFTKKPSKSNMDQFIASGNNYKELWIDLMSQEKSSEEYHNLNEILELDDRNIDYKKLDAINDAQNTSPKFFEYLIKNFDDKNIRVDEESYHSIESRNWYSGTINKTLNLHLANTSPEGENVGPMNFTEMKNSFPEISGDKKYLPSNVNYKPKVLAKTTYEKDNEQFSLVTKLHKVPNMIASSQEIGVGTFEKPQEIKFTEVNIDQIAPPFSGSRQNFKDQDSATHTNIDGHDISNDFINAISAQGILKPIEVSSMLKTSDNFSKENESISEVFEIVDGRRRFLVAKHLGYKSVPIRQVPYQIIDAHNFINHSITASDFIKGHDDIMRNANRRWYFKNPSESHKDLMFSAIKASAHPRWRNINLDDYIKNIKHAWRANRSDFHAMLGDALNNGHFNYQHNDRRLMYPSLDFKSSEDLERADKELFLSTFTLPHERIWFEEPHFYFAFQDSYHMKPKGDIALQPFKKTKYSDHGHHLARIWRDVVIYSPDFVTVRSATTNVDCLNSTAIPDNPRWVLSNEMPSISNQTMIKFAEKLYPEIAKTAKEKNKILMDEHFKNA